MKVVLKGGPWHGHVTVLHERVHLRNGRLVSDEKILPGDEIIPIDDPAQSELMLGDPGNLTENGNPVGHIYKATTPQEWQQDLLVFCYKGKTFVCDTTRLVQTPGNWRRSSATHTKTDSPSPEQTS